MAGETVGRNPLGVGQILNYFHFAIFLKTKRMSEHWTEGGRYQLVGVGIGVGVGDGVGIGLGVGIGVATGAVIGVGVGVGADVDVGVNDGVGIGNLASIVPRFQVFRHLTGGGGERVGRKPTGRSITI